MNFVNTSFPSESLNYCVQKYENPKSIAVWPCTPLKITVFSNSDSQTTFQIQTQKLLFTKLIINAVLFCTGWLHWKTMGNVNRPGLSGVKSLLLRHLPQQGRRLSPPCYLWWSAVTWLPLTGSHVTGRDSTQWWRGRNDLASYICLCNSETPKELSTNYSTNLWTFAYMLLLLTCFAYEMGSELSCICNNLLLTTHATNYSLVLHPRWGQWIKLYL